MFTNYGEWDYMGFDSHNSNVTYPTLVVDLPL